jgi:hypothetical protein
MTNQSTNGWNKDGSLTTTMQFKNYSSTTNLACPNETDQFAVSNNKAKLTYPVSLINNEEWYNIGTSSLRKTSAYYWDLSPYYFNDSNASVRNVNSDGSLNSGVFSSYGSRPAVSLNSGAVISSGDGSEESPWVVRE